MIIVKIQKSGGSYYITLPRDMLRVLEANRGDYVCIFAGAEEVIIRPLRRAYEAVSRGVVRPNR